MNATVSCTGVSTHQTLEVQWIGLRVSFVVDIRLYHRYAVEADAPSGREHEATGCPEAYQEVAMVPSMIGA